MVRSREEEWHYLREREKDESEKEINTQKTLKIRDTSAIVSGNCAPLYLPAK